MILTSTGSDCSLELSIVSPDLCWMSLVPYPAQVCRDRVRKLQWRDQIATGLRRVVCLLSCFPDLLISHVLWNYIAQCPINGQMVKCRQVSWSNPALTYTAV